MTLRVNVLRIALAIVLSPVKCIGNSQPQRGGRTTLNVVQTLRDAFCNTMLLLVETMHILSLPTSVTCNPKPEQ